MITYEITVICDECLKAGARSPAMLSAPPQDAALMPLSLPELGYRMARENGWSVIALLKGGHRCVCPACANYPWHTMTAG